VKEVFQLKLASGREIKATANHPFLTYDGWKPLGELASGARSGSLRHVPPPLDVEPWDEDEVTLLAHLLGDGSFVKRQPIRYASIDEANLTAVAEAAHRRFGITAVRDDYAAAARDQPSPAPRRTGWPAASATRSLRGSTAWASSASAATRSSSPRRLRACRRGRSPSSSATCGPPTAPSAGTQGRAGPASTTPAPAAAWSTTWPVSSCATTSSAGSRRREGGLSRLVPLQSTGVENQLRFCEEIGVHGSRG
jgi:replicative DNA helicase